jgi:bacteriorhodopsin
MVGLPCSLRVAVVAFVIFFAVAFIFLFVFFLVWLLSKEDIGGYRPIRRVRVRGILDVCCSCPMVRLAPLWQRSNNGRLTDA